MKNVPEHQKADRILKYQNMVDEDIDQKTLVSRVKVTFMTKNNDRFRYYFRKRENDNPQVSIDRVTKHFGWSWW